MSRLERWLHHAANALVAGTGLVYLVMAWMLTPVDDWAVVNHPWQPQVQHVHVLVAPLLIFAVGALWKVHIVQRVRMQGRIRAGSGPILVLLFLPMAVSGYALQVSTARDAWAWVHVVTGLLWVLGSVVHVVRSRARSVEMRGRTTPPHRAASGPRFSA